MEALLVEIRHEQDVQLKRVAALHARLDTVSERVEVNRSKIQRMSQRRKTPARQF
jgi:hypothetical protein